ncbi:unnamed protein product, partial [Amoebophrya sp. A25]|eukprot:GSA25T00000276001.1
MEDKVSMPEADLTAIRSLQEQLQEKDERLRLAKKEI